MTHLPFLLSAGLTLLLLLIAAAVSILCFALCKLSGKWETWDDKEQLNWIREREQNAKNHVPKKG